MRSKFFAVLVPVTVAACADTAPTAMTDPLAVTTASSPVSVVELRLTGQCVTEFAPPPFPLPPSIQQIDTGTCVMSHLGRSEFHAEQDIDFINGTAVSSDVRFTAANGDVLLATNAGTFVPAGPGVRISAVMTFTGGTGRFANATGEASIEGQVDFGTNTTRFSFVDGSLVY